MFKEGLKKTTIGTVQDRIARLLFSYRITPHTTTGLSPSEMLFGRKLRSRLDLLKPDLQQNVQAKQLKQKADRDRRCRPRHFEEGESVFAKNYASGEKWLPGTIASRKGPVSFEVELSNGRKCRRHQDQLRKRVVEEQDDTSETDDLDVTWDIDVDQPETVEPSADPEPEIAPEPEQETGNHRYPSRTRNAPDRYGH